MRDLAINDDAFAARFGRADRGASTLLEALAWAEGDGLPLRDGLWMLVAGALRPQAPPFADEHVQWVLREAGRYIIESGDGEQAVYRLFHQSLNEHFRAGKNLPKTGERIAAALLRDVGEHGGWDHANPYIVRQLPAYCRGHNARLERLCTDPWYLRRALDLLGVDRLAEMLATAYRTFRIHSIEAVAKSVQRARVVLHRDPGQLVTQLHARLAGEEAGALKGLIQHLPLAAPRFWLRSRGAALGWRAALQTMQTFGAKVRALAFGFIDGTSVIAVGKGSEIMLWNPRTGALPAYIDNDGQPVTGLAIGMLDEREVLAVAGYDGRLVIRDAHTGRCIGAPMHCSLGMVAMGLVKGRVVVVVPDGTNYVIRTIDGGGPMLEQRIVAAGVGQFGSTPVAIERDGHRCRVVGLESGQPIGPEFDLPQTVKLMAIGEQNGEPLLCYAEAGSNLLLRDLRTGRQLGNATALDFPLRTLVVGDVDGEIIVAAGNDTDNEAGYVAIRQPLTAEASARPLDEALRQKRILGVGLATMKGERSRKRIGGGAGVLALIFEGVGAVDPLTSELLAGAPGDGARIEVLNGAWSVPATVKEDTPMSRNSYCLRRDRPLQWPITCEAWHTISGRLFQARGSYAGAVWILDAQRGKVVAGPFRSVGEETQVMLGAKFAPAKGKEPSSRNPAGRAVAVSLATWNGRQVVAVASQGSVTVFDVESGMAVGSPESGKSEIVAVALGEFESHALLATGSSGGAITIWEGPSMERLASVTIDIGARGVWLAGSVLTVRTADDRFHVFDLWVNKPPIQIGSPETRH